MKKLLVLTVTTISVLVYGGEWLPVSVDVLVVGGTSAAVEAALAAKTAGQDVFLVAPRPALGEDTAGRLEFAPIPVADERLDVAAKFTPAADGKKTRAQVTFHEATEVTRLEMVTLENGVHSGTKECHFIATTDGRTWSSVTPLKVAMNYSPGGRYVWRAELNRRVKAIAVGATASDAAKKVAVTELRVFKKAAPGATRRPTPLEAKVALDAQLAQAKVPYLTGAMAIDTLRDAEGKVAGVVFATRAGKKTIRAKTVVDRSWTVGTDGAPRPNGTAGDTVRLSRVVLSGDVPSAPGLTVEPLDQTWEALVQIRGKALEPVPSRLYRCSFDWTLDDTPLGWAAAEMRARALTWTPQQFDGADTVTSPVVPKTIYTDANPFVVDCDVCVVGAGTAGAPATIAAVRGGAKTIAVDYQYGLGGLGTMGMIGYYWYGTVCGFTAEVEKGIAALGAKAPGVGKREWWRRTATDAGAQVLFGSLAYDVIKEGRAIVGVKVATPYGVVLIRCKVAIDATGSADLAAAAGEKTEYVGANELLMQSAGLAPRLPGHTYVNSDFGHVNDNDPVDTTLFARRARLGATGEWDVSSHVGTRERRRLVGDFRVEPEDVLNERTFPDTIATGTTDFDTHGPTVAEVCFLSPVTEKRVFKLNIPYRALLPATTENLLVCGIGASGHRDALPFMRMQADVQNEGYAAGCAAALAVKTGTTPRTVDVKAVQRHLAEIGSIPKEALAWSDNFPLGEADWQAALAAVADGFKGVPRILADKPRAKRDLHDLYLTETDPTRRLALAQVLAMLGDPIGADDLVANLSKPWNKALHIVPDGAKRFGKRMANRDAQLVALGRTHAACALPVVAAEIATVKPSNGLSRIRAVALAAGSLADASLAPVLAAALRQKGMGGFACADPATLGPLAGFTRTDGPAERGRCEKELHLARALLLCGDHGGLGRRTLEAYATDPRGVYAAHARAVLAASPETVYPSASARVSGMCGARLTEEDGALVVAVKPHEPWSGARVTLAKTMDMSQRGRMVAVVSNRTARVLNLQIHAKTPEEANKFLHGRLSLAPQAVGYLEINPKATKTRPSDIVLPGIRDYEEPPQAGAFDPSRIGLVNIFCDPQEESAEFALLKLMVESSGKARQRRLTDDGHFFPFVDRYGQYAHEDWPGKTKGDGDLVCARRAEEADLAAHSDGAIPDADRFGGWAKGPQLKATGAFRVEKVSGKWWFVDPDGHLFYSQGVNAIFAPEPTGVTGREKFFAELPDRADKAYAACWAHKTKGTVRGYYQTHFPFDTFSFGTANMIRKYGSDWWTSFTELPHRRMRAWGLNTIGNWSSRGVTEKSRTVYTDTFSTRARPVRSSNGFWRKFPDVFAPEFQANAEADAAELAKRSGSDPWCLGWFVDNELSWGNDDVALAKEVLASPEDQPARIEFLKVLAAKAIDPQQVPDAELKALTRRFADRYFTVVREAIKKVAPNRLYLGCRIAWGGSEVWKSAAEHCDVVSANIYGLLPQKSLMKHAGDKPILIGEFHFGALDRGSLSAGLGPTADQQDRAEHYKAYVRAALADPQIVGAHWFLWADQPLTGRFDGECYQTGLVDVTDKPYPEMVAAMRELAQEIYK